MPHRLVHYISIASCPTSQALGSITICFISITPQMKQPAFQPTLLPSQRPLSRGPLNVTHFLAVQPRAEIPFSFVGTVGLGSGRWVPWRKLIGQFHPLHLSALRWLNCPPWFSQLQGPIPGVAILSPNDPCPQHFQGTQKIEVNLLIEMQIVAKGLGRTHLVSFKSNLRFCLRPSVPCASQLWCHSNTSCCCSAMEIRDVSAVSHMKGNSSDSAELLEIWILSSTF